MKIVLLFFVFVLYILPCRAQEGYHITGNLGQLQQDTFYLVMPNLNGSVNVLGASILKDGNIEFRGRVPEPDFRSARFDPVNVRKYELHGSDWCRVY